MKIIHSLRLLLPTQIVAVTFLLLSTAMTASAQTTTVSVTTAEKYLSKYDKTADEYQFFMDGTAVVDGSTNVSLLVKGNVNKSTTVAFKFNTQLLKQVLPRQDKKAYIVLHGMYDEMVCEGQYAFFGLKNQGNASYVSFALWCYGTMCSIGTELNGSPETVKNARFEEFCSTNDILGISFCFDKKDLTSGKMIDLALNQFHPLPTLWGMIGDLAQKRLDVSNDASRGVKSAMTKQAVELSNSDCLQFGMASLNGKPKTVSLIVESDYAMPQTENGKAYLNIKMDDKELFLAEAVYSFMRMVDRPKGMVYRYLLSLRFTDAVAVKTMHSTQEECGAYFENKLKHNNISTIVYGMTIEDVANKTLGKTHTVVFGPCHTMPLLNSLFRATAANK